MVFAVTKFSTNIARKIHNLEVINVFFVSIEFFCFENCRIVRKYISSGFFFDDRKFSMCPVKFLFMLDTCFVSKILGCVPTFSKAETEDRL